MSLSIGRKSTALTFHHLTLQMCYKNQKKVRVKVFFWEGDEGDAKTNMSSGVSRESSKETLRGKIKNKKITWLHLDDLNGRQLPVLLVTRLKSQKQTNSLQVKMNQTVIW